MAKKASSKNTSRRFLDLWPGHFTWVHALMFLSVTFNIAVVALLILLARNDPFEDLYVHKGSMVMCSDEYRDKQSDELKASLTYRCAEGKAYDHYLKGYNEYRASLGLPAVER